MKILCISTSNVRSHREVSTSTRVCELAKERILLTEPAAEVRLLSLLDYDLKPCEMCGDCFESGQCPHDHAFNQIYDEICWADGIVTVIPHYALAPAKLVILLEKLQERVFYHIITDTIAQIPFLHRKVALIGHGGAESDFEVRYRRNLLDPIHDAFAGIGMKAVDAGEASPHGVVFGVKGSRKEEGTVLPAMIHDWEEIRQQIAPLLENLLKAL